MKDKGFDEDDFSKKVNDDATKSKKNLLKVIQSFDKDGQNAIADDLAWYRFWWRSSVWDPEPYLRAFMTNN